MLRFRSFNKSQRQEVFQMMTEVTPPRYVEEMEDYLEAFAHFMQIKRTLEEYAHKVNLNGHKYIQIHVEYRVGKKWLLVPVKERSNV